MIVASLLGIMVVFGSCAPTIDGSSEETYEASIEEVTKSLAGDEALEFAGAMMAIGLAELDMGAVMRGEATAEDGQKAMRERLNGKTASEVIAIAEQVKKEQAARERERGLAKIEELRDKQASAEAAKADLEKLRVTSSRFYKRYERYGRDQPIIDLVMVNELDKPVSRVFMDARIVTADRSVPWYEDKFNFEVPGGIEPGETKSRKLAPNSYGDWGKVEAPKDAELQVEVTRLLTTGDEVLADGEGLSDFELKELKELIEKYEQ